MLAGEMYRGSDPELAAERRRARRLLARLNASDPAERPAIARELFAAFGEEARLETPFQCDYRLESVHRRRRLPELRLRRPRLRARGDRGDH